MTYEETLKHFGKQYKIASACGISPPAVAVWKYKGVPLTRQYQIQVITKGKLKAEAV